MSENRRLAPLVEIGYRICRGHIPVPDDLVDETEPAQPPATGCSEEAYVQQLEQEIRENYSSRKGTLAYLISGIRNGSLSPFTEEDCHAAVALLDEFLRDGLFIESGTGGGREGIDQLKRIVPGLPEWLYDDVMGYYAYINR